MALSSLRKHKRCNDIVRYLGTPKKDQFSKSHLPERLYSPDLLLNSVHFR